MSGATEKASTVYFNDGCVKWKDYAFIVAKLHAADAEEATFSRVFTYDNGQWLHTDFQWNVCSIIYSEFENAIVILSTEGNVSLMSKTGTAHEKISSAGIRDGLGAVKQIRQIGKSLYVCGDQGQVFKRDSKSKRWTRIDKGILDPKISASALDLNAIAGTAEDDIYVAGFRGRILHFDGKRWTELDSPTNCNLERILVTAANEIYICGDHGTLFRKNGNGFQDLSTDKLQDDFWGMAEYNGKIYLATLHGIHVYDGKSISAVKTGLKPKIGSYRLDARDGMLWSFGVDDLAFFDGNKWTRVHHPDNE